MRKTRGDASGDFLLAFLIVITTALLVGPCGFKAGKETVYDAIRKNPEAFIAAVNSLNKTNKEQEELKKLVIEMESGGK